MSANGRDRGYIDWSPGTAKTRAKLEAVLKVLADYEEPERRKLLEIDHQPERTEP